MLVIDEAGERMYYGYRDYQGSLLAMAGADGIVCERYAYDPWGKRVKSDDWIVTDTRSGFLTNRGYTGHEHIDWGDQTLINMNGRVYDPYTAMFYSPDPFIQAPDNWVNYNRYAYCMNNPFKYTDPSGEFAWVPFAIAAVVGGVTNWAINGAELSWKGLGYFGVGALGGVAGLAAGGAVGAGVGGFFAGGLNGMVTGATVGFINCFGTSLVAGDDIVTAALSGLKQMGIGAVTGFAVGGVVQGIQSVFQGKGFLTGSEKLSKITTETKVSNVSLPSEVQGGVAGKGGGRVFWSGGGNKDVEAAARKFATDNGMTTLEMTNAGKNLLNLTQGMPWTEKAPMWQRLSTQFARGANATVHVFQNAGGIGLKSIWGKVEYPILQQNGVNIIYHIVP